MYSNLKQSGGNQVPYKSLDVTKLGQSKVMDLQQRGMEQNSQRLEELVVKHHGRGSPSGFLQ